MSAIRSVRAAEGKFVQISNAAAQDQRLSLRARGVILLVLSLPPEQHFTAKWLESQVPEGREAIRSALRELERFGYLHRARTHGPDGLWSWEQILSDAPIQVDELPCDGNPSDGCPSDGKPSDKRSNTEDPKDVGPVDMASRRARAKAASANLTVADAINAVREAVAQAGGDAEAEALSDGDALGLFFTYVGKRRPRDLVAYLAKIFGDAPYIDTFISNSGWACPRCQKWEADCQCAAA